MYFTVGAAFLAFDFCISKTLRILRNVHQLYTSAHRTFSHPLKNELAPLQIEFKLGVATALLTEYQQQQPDQNELGVRYVLKHLQSTSELIQCETNRLEQLSRKLQRRWIIIIPADWDTETKMMKHLIKVLDHQLTILLSLRR